MGDDDIAQTVQLGRHSVLVKRVNAACVFKILQNVSADRGKILDLAKMSRECTDIGINYNPVRFAACSFYMGSGLTELRRQIAEEMSVFDIDSLDQYQAKSIHQTVIFLVFAECKVVVTGAQNRSIALVMANRFCELLNTRLGLACRVTDFKLKNVVITCRVPFNVNLAKLRFSKDWAGQINYDNEVFPLTCISAEKRQTADGYAVGENASLRALVGFRGSVTITGARTKEEAIEYLKRVYPLISANSIQKGEICPEDMRKELMMHTAKENDIWNAVESIVKTSNSAPEQQSVTDMEKLSILEGIKATLAEHESIEDKKSISAAKRKRKASAAPAALAAAKKKPRRDA